jgi:hypothetical protein
LIILVILSSTGCSTFRRVTKAGQNNVLDAYSQGLSSARSEAADHIKENLKVNKAFGYVKPYVPVVEPADVRMVWIPAHKSKHSPDVLVSGHWVYVMVKPARWFIEAETEDKAKIPLIIPYQEKGKK